MHHFSEKARFDGSRYANAQRPAGAAATPGDTSSYQTLTPASSETAPGQTHGALHHSPDTLKQARPRGPGEFDDTRDVDLAEEIESKPAEEAAADGQRTLPGSHGGAAPGQFRGYHTSARTAQGQGQEGGTEMGVDPSIRFTPSEGEGRWTLRPPAAQTRLTSVPLRFTRSRAGGSVGNAEVGRSSFHTWARRLPLPGVGSGRRGLRTQVVARASGGPQGEGGPSQGDQGKGATSEADRDQATRPSERSAAEQPESGAGAAGGSSAGAAATESDVEGPGADAVMERRVDDPEVGGIAS
ncbi:hypothetical protein C2E21_2130 [Chlorella sorokiniana]|uniref:Uncharacterized protein n=1 Tax=Chlorella sorokiniana TaxID=3076 RepID=A0A2P6TYC7_CHLSO|nr:hypothetical protein C2E21_2130 [Chlorella sorokiniana]|eukprot:PRW59058.1 hypothetical protein C2E21_2130 [Chlorella sorokiniana]